MKINVLRWQLMFYSAPGWSTFQEREYNTRYIKNAVLYDIADVGRFSGNGECISAWKILLIWWFPIYHRRGNVGKIRCRLM